MNDWFKLQKYIKIVYDRHLKPFLNVNVPGMTINVSSIVVVHFWQLSNLLTLLGVFLLNSVIYYGNSLARLVSRDKFVAEKPIKEQS